LFTLIASGLVILVVVAIIFRRNELRTLAITLLSILVMSMMVFGIVAARRQSVSSFDVHGEEIARKMIAGVEAYDSALSDVRIGIALAFLGLLILAATGRQTRKKEKME